MSKLNIIGLMGHAGSGKDTVGRMIAGKDGCMGFADKLKDICREMFELPRHNLYDEKGKEEPLPQYPGWTGRKIAQHIGTEGFRRVHNRVWIDFGLRNARGILTHKQIVCITDVRFQNEMEAIREVGGEVWIIRRPGHHGDVGISRHASETFISTVRDNQVDAVIENDGSLDLLGVRVRNAMQEFRNRR